MTVTSGVVEQHGVSELLPQALQLALAANDRLKFSLTLLQAAATHAAHAGDPPDDLRSVRSATGVGDVAYEKSVSGSCVVADDVLLIPESARLRNEIFHDLGVMLEPLKAAAAAVPELGEVSALFERRLTHLDAEMPRFDADHVATSAVVGFTGLASAGRDTVHQFVMDLHHQLTQLQARVPLRDVAGACTWGLSADDELRVTAFMTGLASTAPLKFDHPGLSTSATRAGERLSIQNDLGTTDAHVVVLHVAGATATIVYSDVHRKRVRFFRQLLSGYPITWEERESWRASGLSLLIGTLRVDTVDALDRFLGFFASRLVFLIDWNRARKELARLARRVPTPSRCWPGLRPSRLGIEASSRPVARRRSTRRSTLWRLFDVAAF